MTEPAKSEVPAQRGRRAQRGPKKRVRPRVSVFGVVGEVLMTGGVLVFLFLGWQLWWNDAVMAASQSRAAESISQGWLEEAKPDPAPAPAVEEGYGDPVVAAAPGDATPFAVLYVPRFGDTYKRTIAEGTGTNVLNSPDMGIGHYPGTQMPGEVGNFAIASHRSANGGGMHLINELQLGDAIYVQTADGYYTYRFRDFEYVPPSAVEAIAPVPHDPDGVPVDRLIALTTCNPLLSTAERIIAYGVFESWQPTGAGPPAELAALLPAA
ncbi:class E sortase [Cryobacterium lactosi]|uniref:Class E sortase n=1 Tax=Cryobacterium lactosi TaxID=1259202 RepID=A0A4V3IW97_9MICO|nr:class E sortase [Cryobacterium lactosi]TFD84396.1 class E sortase [Cryobacterium lactosi]